LWTLSLRRKLHRQVHTLTAGRRSAPAEAARWSARSKTARTAGKARWSARAARTAPEAGLLVLLRKLGRVLQRHVDLAAPARRQRFRQNDPRGLDTVHMIRPDRLTGAHDARPPRDLQDSLDTRSMQHSRHPHRRVRRICKYTLSGVLYILFCLRLRAKG